MTDEQRELLLKARQSLEAAKLLLTNNFSDYATSRAYYSMFYIAEAFLEGKLIPTLKGWGFRVICHSSFVIRTKDKGLMTKDKAVKQRGLGGFPHERLLNPKGGRLSLPPLKDVGFPSLSVKDSHFPNMPPSLLISLRLSSLCLMAFNKSSMIA